MISVEVRNFQSIERASFQIDGFTSLVGRSNIGKSALVRAVKCALTGAPVAEFVRHGAACARKTKKQKTCRCHVSVRVKGDSFDLLWEKGDAVNRYVFNGAEYPAAERGMPDFLLPIFNEIRVGGKDVLLQVADQFSPIFLLDQSATAVADVLSDMAKLDQVNIAISMVEKDRREASTTRKVREKDLADSKTKLTRYDGVNGLVLDVHAVRAKLAEIQHGREKANGLVRFIQTHDALQMQIDRLDGVSSIVLPDPAPLRRLRDTYTALQRMFLRAKDRKAAFESLRGVDTLTLPVLAPLLKQAETTQRLSGWISRLIGFRASLSRFKVIPSVDLPTTLPNEAAERNRRLHSLLSRLENLTRTLSSLEDDHRIASDEEEVVKQEWNILGVCSTCSRPFHPDLHPSGV